MAPVKRHAYTAEFKLKAVSHAVEHGNRVAAREFNINESSVRGWRKQADALRQAKKTSKSFRGNKARWPQCPSVASNMPGPGSGSLPSLSESVSLVPGSPVIIPAFVKARTTLTTVYN